MFTLPPKIVTICHHAVFYTAILRSYQKANKHSLGSARLDATKLPLIHGALTLLVAKVLFFNALTPPSPPRPPTFSNSMDSQ